MSGDPSMATASGGIGGDIMGALYSRVSQSVTGLIPTSVTEEGGSDSPVPTSFAAVKSKFRALPEFFDVKRIKIKRQPGDGEPATGSRIKLNLKYFAVNYGAILMIIFLYSTLTHPLFLISFSVTLGGWYFVLRGQPITVLGRTFAPQEQKLGMMVITLLVLIFTSVWSTLFWIVSVSALLIFVHAYLYSPIMEADFDAVPDYKGSEFATPPPIVPDE